jgi:hypothetical protein
MLKSAIMLRSIPIFLLVSSYSVSFASAQALHLSPDKLRAHVKYLASDELEGRGVGTRGEKLATEYLAAQLALNGAKPGGENGTYFQRVPLVGTTTLPGATMVIEGHGKKTPLVFVKDYVGTAFSQVPQNDFNAEAVFVGHGISAPEFGWDDYKGVDLIRESTRVAMAKK